MKFGGQRYGQNHHTADLPGMIHPMILTSGQIKESNEAFSPPQSMFLFVPINQSL